MKKILLIRSRDKSGWHSQNQVHRQLEKAYRTAFPESCSVIESADGRLVRRLSLESADRIVLLDHHLDFSRLANGLKPLLASKPGLNVHLFADFLTRPGQISAALALKSRLKVKFFVASRWMKAEVLKKIPGADVAVLPSPVSDVFFETPLGKPAKRLPRWVYAGRIHPDKGLDQFLEHLLRLDALPFQFEILGDWSDNRYESWSATPDDFAFRQKKLKSLIDVLGLKPRLMRTESSLADSFRDFDAFVFPSIFKCEEYGYALAQALAAGKNCWISDWRGHRDFSGCPGVRMIRVLESEAIPRLDFHEAFQSGNSSARALPAEIRSWAYRNHSVAAAAAKLKTS